MDTEATAAATSATDPTPADSSRWFYGCAIAVIVFFVLIMLGAAAVTEFEKSLDGDGQMEQPGLSGSVSQPLGPGATARYEDGLWVTVSRPQPHDDGTYSLTVTFKNGTDEELRLNGDSYPPPLAVRAGESGDDYAGGYSVSWLNSEKSRAALVPPLAEGKERGVTVRMKPTRKGVPVTVEVSPPDAGYRETAHFQLTLG
ncbi:hypothetical protein [Streptomyces sp. rh34]|uniref:hypothetical protein n=1 Tax=Streptomyces sp. rh34 TaxID=2034272 RepID=UPI000BF0BC64|nr:hypothetical protein [Streptomyces sp. rh34]